MKLAAIDRVHLLEVMQRLIKRNRDSSTMVKRTKAKPPSSPMYKRSSPKHPERTPTKPGTKATMNFIAFQKGLKLVAADLEPLHI